MKEKHKKARVSVYTHNLASLQEKRELLYIKKLPIMSKDVDTEK